MSISDLPPTLNYIFDNKKLFDFGFIQGPPVNNMNFWEFPPKVPNLNFLVIQMTNIALNAI